MACPSGSIAIASCPLLGLHGGEAAGAKLQNFPQLPTKKSTALDVPIFFNLGSCLPPAPTWEGRCSQASLRVGGLGVWLRGSDSTCLPPALAGEGHCSKAKAKIGRAVVPHPPKGGSVPFEATMFGLRSQRCVQQPNLSNCQLSHDKLFCIVLVLQ